MVVLLLCMIMTTEALTPPRDISSAWRWAAGGLVCLLMTPNRLFVLSGAILILGMRGVIGGILNGSGGVTLLGIVICATGFGVGWLKVKARSPGPLKDLLGYEIEEIGTIELAIDLTVLLGALYVYINLPLWLNSAHAK
ncbi:MAG TPA: hypothetical protein VMV61_07770 [Patescibacteria group bacterium]|nr:hypothetical protein [Patescibacteria group bacterium]